MEVKCYLIYFYRFTTLGLDALPSFVDPNSSGTYNDGGETSPADSPEANRMRVEAEADFASTTAGLKV